MVDKIVELANILNSDYDWEVKDAARKELKDIIIPKVEKINELFVKTNLPKHFELNGFEGNVFIKNDCDWNGKILDKKNIILIRVRGTEEGFGYHDNTYIDLDYFNKSDEELLEMFKEESISQKQLLIEIQTSQIETINAKMIELKNQIEKIKKESL